MLKKELLSYRTKRVNVDENPLKILICYHRLHEDFYLIFFLYLSQQFTLLGVTAIFPYLYIMFIYYIISPAHIPKRLAAKKYTVKLKLQKETSNSAKKKNYI